MRILIVEDDRWRLEWFKQNLKNHCLYITKDVDDACKALHNRYDILFLDHDLADEHYISLAAGKEVKEGTGYEVAKYIKENNINIKTIVHSWNSVGAANILYVLPDSIYTPFATENFKEIVDKLNKNAGVA